SLPGSLNSTCARHQIPHLVAASTEMEEPNKAIKTVQLDESVSVQHLAQLMPLLKLADSHASFIPQHYPPFQQPAPTLCPTLTQPVLENPDKNPIPMCTPLCLLPVITIKRKRQPVNHNPSSSSNKTGLKTFS
uniref:Uncharacterized protein n=1 Tax=Acrobeloides nanus TaxID=290746 RepID=A0A914DCE9_9BILA